MHVLDPKAVAAALTSPVTPRADRDDLEAAALTRLRERAHDGDDLVVRVGTPVEVILEEAERAGADLIVMGTHGRTGINAFLNGSVAERVVRLAQRPVLIEHERPDEG